MAKTKYWKTTVTTTVLTEGENPPIYASPRDLASDFYDGDAVGTSEQTDIEVSKDEMAKLLVKAGSEPAFFIYDYEGFN